MPERGLGLLLLAIALVLGSTGACTEGQDSNSHFSGGPGLTWDGGSSGSTGDGATSGDGGTSTGGTSTGSASEATTSGDLTAASDPTTSTTGPECGDLQVCGVQCADLSSDPDNCGDCGISCVIPHATAFCTEGVCGLGDCAPGYGDCDGEIVNGCETALRDGEACGELCKPGDPETCNLFDDNCDGTCDEGAGCRVAIHRAYSASLGHVYTPDLQEAQAGDHKLESENYYFLYSAPLPGLVPFHRCTKGNGKPFYTKSATCENNATLVGVIGYVAQNSICGATELYRLYHSGAGAHFYTTSANERDNAESMYGFKYESVAGFVFKGP